MDKRLKNIENGGHIPNRARPAYSPRRRRPGGSQRRSSGSVDADSDGASLSSSVEGASPGPSMMGSPDVTEAGDCVVAQDLPPEPEQKGRFIFYPFNLLRFYFSRACSWTEMSQ